MQTLFDSFIRLSLEMAPYLVLGFLLAGIVHEYLSAKWIQKHLGGKSFNQVIKATVFGIPLPICSCGIIPLAKELRNSGASKGGTVSFLTSTPQTGVDSIIATSGMLGLPFAILRVTVAFVSGIVAGSLVNLFDKSPKNQTRANTAPTPAKAKKNIPGKAKDALLYGLIELPNEIRNSLLVGLSIAAVISAFMPEPNFGSAGVTQLLNYLIVILIAIPLYVCSTGSIPIAIALIMSGFSPGAACIFLIAGPATNIVTLTFMVSHMGYRTTLVYLTSVIGIGLLAAWWVDSTTLGQSLAPELVHHHEMGITPLQIVSLSILIVSLLIPPFQDVISKLMHKPNTPDDYQSEWDLQIEGMTCPNCAKHLEKALNNDPNYHTQEIKLESGEVRIQAKHKTVQEDSLSSLVQTAGYHLKGLSKASS